MVKGTRSITLPNTPRTSELTWALNLCVRAVMQHWAQLCVLRYKCSLLQYYNRVSLLSYYHIHGVRTLVLWWWQRVGQYQPRATSSVNRSNNHLFGKERGLPVFKSYSVDVVIYSTVNIYTQVLSVPHQFTCSRSFLVIFFVVCFCFVHHTCHVSDVASDVNGSHAGSAIQSTPISFSRHSSCNNRGGFFKICNPHLPPNRPVSHPARSMDNSS